MKNQMLVTLAVTACIVSFFIATALAQQAKLPRYKLVDLGTFGGPQSYVSIPEISYSRVLNNRGTVVGWSDTPFPDPFPDFCFDGDCQVAHAFKATENSVTDLFTLPGGPSSQASWISPSGLIAGASQNGDVDPLVPGFPEFRAALWRDQELIDLGTLGGGYESIATSVNDRGQVVGFATNTVSDPNSMFGLGFQTRAFLWQNGVMQDLGTLGTGTNAAALLINEQGQVAGVSYTSTQSSSLCAEEGLGPMVTGAFLWDHGVMRDLGNFGGSCTFAFAINKRGQVSGGSRLIGDVESHPFLWDGSKLNDLGTFGGGLGTAIALNDAGEAAGWATYPRNELFHAAVWRRGKIQDIGVLPGDSSSFAFDINSRGQVVGLSIPPDGDFDSAHAFLWQRGRPMVALESLIVGGSSLRLTETETINDRGEIAGEGFDANGDQHAFLMIPCDEQSSAGNCDIDASSAVAQSPTVPSTPHTFPSMTRIPGLRSSGRAFLRGHVRVGSKTQSPVSQTSRSGTTSASQANPLAVDPIFGFAGKCTNCLIKRCMVSGTKLTGYCLEGARGGLCHQAWDPTNCVAGQTAKRIVQKQCGLSTFNVDDLRPCS